MIKKEEGEIEQSPPQLPLSQPLTMELDAIEESLYAIAQQYEGETTSLLLLLRRLEAIHVHIRDNLFQSSLPNNRQRLYALLKDIEMEGGWPYIPRMKIQRLFANLSEDEITSED